MFGFGNKRKAVKKIREKEHKDILKSRRTERTLASEERKGELKRRKLAEKESALQSEASYYRAKAAKQSAKKSASRFPKVNVPTPSVKKRKQGKPLESRKSIGL